MGELFLFVYFIKLQDELDGVGFQDVQNRTWTAAVYLWFLHSFSPPFISVFHCWLHFFLTADGLPLHWRGCRGQCQSVDVFTARGLRKIGSLPPSLSLKNPREEFWLAWPRSCALWQSDTAKWIKSWKAGLYHKPREFHRPCPGGIVIKQAGPAVFCFL